MTFILTFFLFLCGFIVFQRRQKINLSLGTIIFIAFFVRLAVIVLFWASSSEDILSFIKAGEIVLARKADYPYVYLPFIFYLGALSVSLQRVIEPVIFLKIIFSLFEVGIVWMLYFLTKKRLPALLYALNPLTIITSSIHGQMDSLPAFFLLVGLYLFEKKKELLAVLSLSFGIATKAWPLLFVISFFKRMENKLLIFVLAVFPLFFTLLHFLLFGVPPLNIFLSVVGYRGIYGVWGVGQLLFALRPFLKTDLLQLFFVSKIFLSSSFLVIFAFFCFFLKEKKIIREIMIIMFFFFSFTVTFGAQWLAWLVPFLLMEKPKGWLRWYSSATIYTGITFFGDVYHLSMRQATVKDLGVSLLGLVVWIYLVGFFLKYFFGKSFLLN